MNIVQIFLYSNTTWFLQLFWFQIAKMSSMIAFLEYRIRNWWGTKVAMANWKIWKHVETAISIYDFQYLLYVSRVPSTCVNHSVNIPVMLYMLHCDYEILCVNLYIIIVAEPTTIANLYICKLNHFINRAIIAKIYPCMCQRFYKQTHM